MPAGNRCGWGCAARPYLVKPNVVEAEEVTGREIRSDADALTVADFFLKEGIELVSVSSLGQGRCGLRMAAAHFMGKR